MEEVNSLFFDTYALFEIIKGSKNYENYARGISIITTKLNLLELHYALLRVKGKEEADFYFEEFNQFCVRYNDEVLKEASEFRLNNYKRDLSYIDCVGYIVARKLGVKFLTGDQQFKEFDNVEFVK